MTIDMSTEARNALTKVEKTIKRVPEVYRKELCRFLADKFVNPQDYKFQHSNMAVIDAFHEVSVLYSNLCEVDQEVFQRAFSVMIRQFVA